MARLARIVAARVPHLVTQRGNRRQKVFFGDEDYQTYIGLVAAGCREARVDVWAYCLLPRQVYLLLVPSDVDGLRAALGEAHRRYTRTVNLRKDWRGYLWHGRFASFPVDEGWLLACARYVELAPVRAGLVERARDWRWSSARAHLAVRDDALVNAAPLLDRASDWKTLLAQNLDKKFRDEIESHERTGRPLGSDAFIKRLEKRLGRTLARQKPGPKPKKKRLRGNAYGIARA
jgi:putative transposase